MEEQYTSLKIAERGARISIAAYICLSILKLSIGTYFGSKALFADGLNNATDIFSSVAVLIGLRISRKPADENHAYGHFRAETIASLVASLIMIAVGLQVLYQAIMDTIFFKAKAPDLVSGYVAIFCAIFIYVVYRYNLHIATKINSGGLMAAAKDNLSDAFVSIGAAIGIFSSQLNMPWIDPLAASIVGVLIIKTGWEIFYEATHNLSDGFDTTFAEEISNAIAQVQGVKSVIASRGRVHGNITLLDVVIAVDPHLTVVEGHNIADRVETMLHESFAITEVIVHVEPDIE